MTLTEPSANISIDYGHLLITDTNNLTSNDNPSLTETTIRSHAEHNFKHLVRGLFTMLKDQQGEDDITRDYDKAPDEVVLPKPLLTLPRIMPVPKEKPLTKWERYKQEKGIHSRKRRRMVWSDLANDWVPRWGKGSIKKIEKDANWAMEEKETGVNPFDKQKEEQNLKKQKQEMRHLKNQINAAKASGNDNIKTATMSKKARKGMKIQKEIQRLDQDKKNLNKRLEQVQKSTRSMGHFDKKVKNEKELNIIKKKKVDTDVLLNRKHERSRDKAIMESILNKK